MEEADIYYVDTRNADPRDHRVNVRLRETDGVDEILVEPRA